MGKMADRYLSAERIAKQMDLVATLPEEAEQMRQGLAVLFLTQVEFLLSLPDDANSGARYRRAEVLGRMALKFAPELRDSMHQLLPTLAPKRRAEPTTPPAGAGNGPK